MSESSPKKPRLFSSAWYARGKKGEAALAREKLAHVDHDLAELRKQKEKIDELLRARIELLGIARDLARKRDTLGLGFVRALELQELLPASQRLTSLQRQVLIRKGGNAAFVEAIANEMNARAHVLQAMGPIEERLTRAMQIRKNRQEKMDQALVRMRQRKYSRVGKTMRWLSLKTRFKSRSKRK